MNVKLWVLQAPLVLNAVVCARTMQSMAAVLACLKSIEVACDRARTTQKFDQRTMDIDLLLFDHEVADVSAFASRRHHSLCGLKPLADLRPEAGTSSAEAKLPAALVSK